jgi:hypothetical protein
MLTCSLSLDVSLSRDIGWDYVNCLLVTATGVQQSRALQLHLALAEESLGNGSMQPQ